MRHLQCAGPAHALHRGSGRCVSRPDLGARCAICQDTTKIGHHGTATWEVQVTSPDDLEAAKKRIVLAYASVAGGVDAAS